MSLCRLALGSWLCLSGCTSSARPDSASAVEARSNDPKHEVLAAFEQACDLRASDDGSRPAPMPPPGPPPEPPPAMGNGPDLPMLFFEMALFLAPARSVAGAADVRRVLAADPQADLVSTPHLSLQLDQRAHAAFDEHSGPLAHAALRAVDASAKLAGEGRIAVELDVELQLATETNAPAAPVPATRVRFELGVPLQAPTTATAAVPGHPERVVVLLLSPYLLREQRDLRTLFECKMREHQRWLDAARSGGRVQPN